MAASNCGLLALRGRRAQLDEAKGGQPEDASPTAVGWFVRRRAAPETAVGGAGAGGIGGRRRDGRSWLLGPYRRALGRRGAAAPGEGEPTAGAAGRVSGRPGRSRGRRGLGIPGVGTGRARRRGARPVGLQTVPQEFVALVHGLLGCQAIDRRAYGPAAASSARDERHGPTADAGRGPVPVQYRSRASARVPCKLSGAYFGAAATPLAAR